MARDGIKIVLGAAFRTDHQHAVAGERVLAGRVAARVYFQDLDAPARALLQDHPQRSLDLRDGDHEALLVVLGRGAHE